MENEESRTIIFVQTREMTSLMAQYLNLNPPVSGIRSGQLTSKKIYLIKA